MFKKMAFALILALMVLSTGAWQTAQSSAPDAPLYPGFTWTSEGPSVRNIALNIKGEILSLSGETYQAAERFDIPLPQAVQDYYSNEQLAQSGWSSHDAVDLPGGVRKVFYHNAGFYFSVEFQLCPDDISFICATVWMSEKTNRMAAPSVGPEAAPRATFGKSAPANGTANVNPASVVLSWGTFTPTPDKYSYCIKIGSPCDANDPNWTGTLTNTSVTLTNLSYGKTYYWQVKAISCADCKHKIFTYADGGTWWTFTTRPNAVSIVGNAGVGGATLSYTDGTAKTVTADSIGNYSITLPVNWTGTVTPSKAGYIFSPASTSYTNLNAVQTITNYSATAITYTITGNAGVGGATLAYIDGILKTVTAGAGGDYSITVSYNWSGTITPSKTGYTFSPASKSYVNVLANQSAQNYTATILTYTISGNAGVATATLSYIDGVAKTAVSDSIGNYSVTVPYGWSGTVTPSKCAYYFSPATGVTGTYSNVTSNISGQNYTISIFKDVPSSYWAFNYIERLYLAGVTGGCNASPFYYCPETEVTRDQMAIFLLRGIHGSGYTPPPASGSVFTDVPSSYWAAAWIEQLAAEGITGGCGGGNYCPGAKVTRAEMSIFLLKAKHGSDYAPPAATGLFTDVPAGYWARNWVERLAVEGITGGCGANLFCPNANVTRAQMAVFLVKTFGLP